ncbi:hypothetical protein [Streptomyces sp. WAC 01529]|uniref:hypothetical protein n=1 Tax=Streptomyces sp. WAC 01529 TaxID=2203205 RepID=UPI0013E01A61|nr:hypothetical protein [Streptomyces sp. WAC 01529]
MKLGKEWWRTVRYAIGEQRRTARLLGVLVVVGAIMAVLIALGQGLVLTVG